MGAVDHFTTNDYFVAEIDVDADSDNNHEIVVDNTQDEDKIKLSGAKLVGLGSSATTVEVRLKVRPAFDQFPVGTKVVLEKSQIELYENQEKSPLPPTTYAVGSDSLPKMGSGTFS